MGILVTCANPALKRIHQAALQLFAETGTSHVNVSDLAQAAGVARGTIYNNLESPDTLFEDIACQLSAEMHNRVHNSFGAAVDPAARLSFAIRFFIRRAREEPYWGRFMCRFAFSNASLREIWDGPPLTNLLGGLASGRYQFQQEQLSTVVALMAGSVLAAMLLVTNQPDVWREASVDTVEFILRSLGVPGEDARRLAVAELPILLPMHPNAAPTGSKVRE